MKKHIFVLISILGLSACATLRYQPVEWRGQNFDSYIQSYGVPTSSYTLQNGNTVYSFKKVCEYDYTKTGETLVTVGADHLIVNISDTKKCPSYYESSAYEIDQARNRREQERTRYERERKKSEEKRQEKMNDIAGELLNMGTEEEQKLHLMKAETKAIYAESKKKAGGTLNASEEQLIKEAEQARKDFANWEKRHNELSTQLEILRTK